MPMMVRSTTEPPPSVPVRAQLAHGHVRLVQQQVRTAHVRVDLKQSPLRQRQLAVDEQPLPFGGRRIPEVGQVDKQVLVHQRDAEVLHGDGAAHGHHVPGGGH
jgi:hypothetical protein